MPDEIGTETTRADASSADDNPFADVAEDAVAGEEGSNREVEQDPQGSDNADAEASSSEELKVVVSIKGGRATIGVQQPESDPHIESFDDRDLSGLAEEVPAVAERAKARWEYDPRHPVHVKPLPPARRQTRRGQGATQASNAAAEPEQSQQQTLRLF